MSEQQPQPRQVDRARPSAFDLGRLTTGEIVRLNWALCAEERQADYKTYPELEPLPDGASYDLAPELIERPSSMTFMFLDSVCNLPADRAAEVFTAMKDSDDPYAMGVASEMAFSVARHDYELARDGLVTLDRHSAQHDQDGEWIDGTQELDHVVHGVFKTVHEIARQWPERVSDLESRFSWFHG
jgi:hypothetical protein